MPADQVKRRMIVDVLEREKKNVIRGHLMLAESSLEALEDGYLSAGGEVALGIALAKIAYLFGECD